MNRYLYSFVIFSSSLSTAYNYAVDGINIETCALAFITFLISFIYFKEDTHRKDEITYKSISKIENVLITSKNSDQLFKQLCEILVEDANFKLCWMGTVQNELIVPEVVYGAGSTYIQNAYFSINTDKSESSGSSAQAILQNKPIHHSNIYNVTGTSLKIKLKKYKIRSSLSIPIRCNGLVFGVLTIYGEHSNSFSKTVIKNITNLMHNVEIVLESFNTDNFFERVFEGSPNAIIITNAKADIIRVNSKFTEITQYTADDVIGKNPKLLQSGQTPASFYQNLWQTVKTDGYWTGELLNKKKNGEYYTEFATIYSIKNSNNIILNYVAIFYDISEKKLHEEQIHKLMYFDALTGLRNKNFLENNFSKIIYSDLDVFMSMLLIDVSDFKNINVNFGYDFGDELLRLISKRLLAINGEKVFRLNGDKFILIIETKTISSISIICERILKQLISVYTVDDITHRLSFNIGIAIYKTNGIDFNDMLKYSNLALLRSKVSSDNSFAFYDSIFHAQSEYDIKVKNMLKFAITSSELSLKYQPIIDTRNKTVCGVEALLRWKSPSLGEISPSEFLNIAECSGRLWEICDFAIKECLNDVKSFKEQIPSIRLAINISHVQFKRKNFSLYFLDLLTDYQIDPNVICLELSNWNMIKDISDSLQTLTELANSGIKISIDDFGSNNDLSLLYKWPIHKIKIDKIFITELETNYEMRAICQTIINMASKLKIEVIAEGVENKEQMQILFEMGCSLMQGFYFSKAIDKKQLFDFFHQFDIDII